MTNDLAIALEQLLVTVKDSRMPIALGLQEARYFVVLFFIGLSNVKLSIARVATRVQAGGYDVPCQKLKQRFSRTQNAIKAASTVTVEVTEKND